MRLSVVHDCVVLLAAHAPRTYVARSAYYAYEILDHENREVIAFHWHPEGASHVGYPHLHLSSKIQPVALGTARSPESSRTLDIAATHVPTGRVRLEHVVAMLIDEWGVIPQRRDYREVLARSLEAFSLE